MIMIISPKYFFVENIGFGEKNLKSPNLQIGTPFQHLNLLQILGGTF